MEPDYSGKIIKSKIQHSKLRLSNFAIEKDKSGVSGYSIRISKVKEFNVYLDWDLGVHTNPQCAGVWPSVDEARKWIIKKFLN